MNKLAFAVILAGLVAFPRGGITAGSQGGGDHGLNTSVANSLAEAEAAYQKGLAAQAEAQKAADQAAADVAKAEANLKLAQESGNKAKIAAAQAALAKAKLEAAQKTRALSQVNALVQRLKVIVDKAKAAAEVVATSKDPAAVKAAMNEISRLANEAANVLKSIQNVVSPTRPGPGPRVTIPSTTTTTTKPTPTPDRTLNG